MDYQIVYRAYVMDSQGYSRAAREYLFALDRIGLDIKVESLDNQLVGEFTELPEEKAKRLKELLDKPIDDLKRKILIYHAQPYGVSPSRERENGFDKVIINTVWETTKIPDNWFPSVDQADAIIVPSSQNVKALKDSGVTVPVFVSPHGADVSFNQNNKPFPLVNAEESFNFLSIFSWQHRKGPDILLQAFWNEFNKNDNVSLILKTSWGNQGSKKDQRAVRSQIEYYKKRMGFGDDTAPIYYSGSVFYDEDIAGLYTISDVYVLPSRGEGVGLPYIEALASGIPVIATGWGGQIDFVNDNNGYLIDYQLAPSLQTTDNESSVAPNFTNIFTNEMEWAEPSVKSLQKIMRYVYEHQDEAKAKGNQGMKDMLNMSWEKSAYKIKKVIEETLKNEKM